MTREEAVHILLVQRRCSELESEISYPDDVIAMLEKLEDEK